MDESCIMKIFIQSELVEHYQYNYNWTEKVPLGTPHCSVLFQIWAVLRYNYSKWAYEATQPWIAGSTDNISMGQIPLKLFKWKSPKLTQHKQPDLSGHTTPDWLHNIFYFYPCMIMKMSFSLIEQASGQGIPKVKCNWRQFQRLKLTWCHHWELSIQREAMKML